MKVCFIFIILYYLVQIEFLEFSHISTHSHYWVVNLLGIVHWLTQEVQGNQEGISYQFISGHALYDISIKFVAGLSL